ncbi:hypothetical protein [Ruminococcus sp.]|uniref:hypothetical protein n=1 Tax=Ruminococcus sp. TaxID=41978 RepID=UPI001B3ED9AF|nr:hypothetical protein [Ruminococcus sp.]MBP5432911.1 hypothetical protein [Ruminococcus sp.]
MGTGNPKGRAICVAMSVYLIAKAVLNIILRGGFDFADMFIAIGLALIMLTGFKGLNYIAASVLVVVAAIHLPDNISNISSNWIYLIEGIIDIGCAVLLCADKDVREHFSKTITINN